MAYFDKLRKTFGKEPLLYTGVTIIVKNDKNEILLQKRKDTNEWSTIGGSVEPGEDLKDTARRELFEECKLEIKKIKFINLLSGKKYFYEYPNGDQVYLVIAVYEALEWEGKPTVNDDESLEFKFFSIEEAKKILPPVCERILSKSGY